LAEDFRQVVTKKGHACDQSRAEKIVGLLIERASFFDDLWNLGSFFFVSPSEYDEQMARKKWTSDSARVLGIYADKLADNFPTEQQALKQLLWEAADSEGLGIGKVMPGLRLALTGSGGGPDLMDIMLVLGQEETVSRIRKALKRLN
jgi:glutamyl-tRNA synthetase